MTLENRVLGSEQANRTYKKEDGEPSSIQRKIWNGEIFDYQFKLLNQISNERDHKKRFNLLVEASKISILCKHEFEKAGFYKDEFDGMANYLDNIGCLHTHSVTEKVKDNEGKEHIHEYDSKRSIVKSIPSLRAMVKL